MATKTSRPEPANDGRSVGPRLREIRQLKGHPLKEVAANTGVSSSFLSMVENGQSDITVGRLLRLLAFYGVGISELVPDEQPGGDDLVVRRRARQHIDSSIEGVQLFLLAPEIPRVMSPEL